MHAFELPRLSPWFWSWAKLVWCHVVEQDSLQRDRLLNLLAVMQRAAYNVSTEDEDADGQENQDPDGESPLSSLR